VAVDLVEIVARQAPSPHYHYSDCARDDILRMIPDDGRVIGSVGCGWAATEWVLAKSGRIVHGVDVSQEAIEVAKTRLTSARVVSPAEPRLFEYQSLDGLILADVLEHMPNAWMALKDLSQALRPGGWAVISVPNMQSLNVLVQLFFLGDWPEKKMGIFDETHIQMMTRRRLERWCGAADLGVERWFHRYQDNRKGRLFRVIDALSLGVLHDWLTYEWQCVCRKRG